jgi:hypothetical protein
VDEEKNVEKVQADPKSEDWPKKRAVAFWKLPFHWFGIILGAILVLPVGWPLMPVEADPDQKTKSLKVRLGRLAQRLRSEWRGLAAWKRWSIYVGLSVALIWSLRVPSQAEVQAFDHDLLNGNFNPPGSGYFSSLWVWGDRDQARQLLRVLAKDNADPDALKTEASAALRLVATKPDDMIGLTALARWHAWRDERLAAERLALEAVNTNPRSLLPYLLVPEIGAAYCDGNVTSSEQARAMLEVRLHFLDLVEDRGRVAKFFATSFDGIQSFQETGLEALPSFNASAQEWEAARKNTSDFYAKQMSREAFWRFLKDPFKGALMAQDVSDSLSGGGALEAERQAVLSDWRDDTETARKDYDAAVAARPKDKALLRRYGQYLAAWQAGAQSFKDKAERMKQFDPQHLSEDAGWQSLEKFPAARTASTTEPNGEPGRARKLEQEIKDGQAQLAEHETAAEFVYPTDDDLKQWVNQRLSHPHWLQPCPLVLPVEDGTGQRLAMGGFLAFLCMQKAAFAPEAVLSIGNASDLYFNEGFYQPGPAVSQDILPVLMGEWGARAVVRVQVKETGPQWKVLLTWQQDGTVQEFQTKMKKQQLRFLPGLVAKQIHAWMATSLSKEQRSNLSKPEFPTEGLLSRAFDAEQMYRGEMAHAWDWKAIQQEAPESSLAACRWMDVHQNDYQTGFQVLSDWLKVHPGDDYVRIQLAITMANYSRPHRALEIVAPLLDRDLGHRWALSVTEESLETLDAWSQEAQLWQGVLKDSDRRSALIGKYGKFLVDYAWKARGDDSGSSVGEWDAQIFKSRLQKAQTELSKEMTAKNPDPELYQTLMTTAIGLNQEPARLDAILAAADSACPGADGPYVTRLNDLMKKWHGSDSEMFAFAKKNAKEHPLLTILAYDEVYYRARIDNPPQDKVAPEIAYLRGLPGAWDDIDAAYTEMLEKNPDDSQLWENYFMHANWMGQNQEAQDRLEKMSKKSPLLARMRPRLVAQGYYFLLGIRCMPEDSMPKYYAAVEQTLKTEPEDRFLQNYYVRNMVWYKQWPLARKLFTAIGNDRTALIWGPGSYTEAYRQAFGPEGQVER